MIAGIWLIQLTLVRFVDRSCLQIVCKAAEEQARSCSMHKCIISYRMKDCCGEYNFFRLGNVICLQVQSQMTSGLKKQQDPSLHRFAVTLAYFSWGCGSSIISCAFGSGSISDRTLQLRPVDHALCIFLHLFGHEHLVTLGGSSLEAVALTQIQCYSPSLHHVGLENIERHWVTRGIQPPAEEVLVSLQSI